MREQSRRVLEAPTSATVRIADLASTLLSQGKDVLDFSAGQASENTQADLLTIIVVGLILSEGSGGIPGGGLVIALIIRAGLFLPISQ